MINIYHDILRVECGVTISWDKCPVLMLSGLLFTVCAPCVCVAATLYFIWVDMGVEIFSFSIGAELTVL